jgi:hypothetical protein
MQQFSNDWTRIGDVHHWTVDWCDTAGVRVRMDDAEILRRRIERDTRNSTDARHDVAGADESTSARRGAGSHDSGRPTVT